MVKPGGTGKPRLAISARLAPLPPSRSRISERPSALPSPKVKTHLLAGTFAGALLAGAFLAGAAFAATFGAAGLVAAFATGLAAGLATGFGALFTALLGSALRAAGTAFALTEGFDFAGDFFGFEAALAIACTQPARGTGNCGPYTILGGSAQVRVPENEGLEMEPLQ